MNVVVTVASLASRFGGPSRSVPALCNALARQNASVHLISLKEGDEAVFENCLFEHTLIPAKTSRYNPLGWAGKFQKSVCEVISGQGVILHDNGVWLPTNYLVAKCAKKCGAPLVITPRGMLTPWSMNAGRWKKRLAWHLYQKRCLDTARVLHATSMQEAQDFRNLGLKQPIAVVANGVELPGREAGGKERRAEITSQRSDVRTILFLSRIHPKKGLLDLIQAWGMLAKSGGHAGKGRGPRAKSEELLKNWQIVIAGNDEDGHSAELKEEIRKAAAAMGDERGAEEWVNTFQFVGPVEGEAKWELYRSADLFVLPSHSENFGLVVAEALAAGTPVITTRGTPWQDLQTHRCGWWIDIGVEPLICALREAMALSNNERAEMGERGRHLVEQNYSWSNAARQMKSVYEWVLGQGPKPECIV